MRVKKTNFKVPKLLATLAAAYPKKKGIKRLPLFLAIEAVNPDTDCHLHLNVENASDSEYVDLDIGLRPVRMPEPTKSEFPVTLENIATWLGSCIDVQLEGSGYAIFEFEGPHFKPVIPLPFSGVLPIESSIIRKSSIAGLDIVVDESDIGLKRFLLYKANSDTINLSVIFSFAHITNYMLFVKLAEKAAAISSVLVIREKHESSVR